MGYSEALRECTGAISQLLAAIIIAALFWGGHRAKSALRQRPHTEFLRWVGCVCPSKRLRERFWLLGGLILFSLAMTAFEHLLGWDEALAELVATGPVAQLIRIEPVGAALLAGISYAFLRTAGAEEILVRGVLYKRLIPIIGLTWANIVQSLLFTLLHNWIVFVALPDAPLWIHADIFIRIFVMSGAIGWFMEARDNGSLLMPWLCHGAVNLLTFLSLYL